MAPEEWASIVLGWSWGPPSLHLSGREHEDPFCLAKLCDPVPHSVLSHCRFYLCLFSGPLTVMPPVRGLEFVGHGFWLPFLLGLAQYLWKGSGLGAQTWGVGWGR